MQPFEARNRHFDRLVNTPDLMWMGQNTNHASPPPTVLAAMHRVIDKEEYHVYAPPAGFEQLRQLIIEDLRLPGLAAVVTDGAVEALYHVCRTLLGPGDELLTTDPSWQWPMQFAREAGATVQQIPIYGPEYGYRLDPARLARAMNERTRIIYLVDPNNPLGSRASAAEIEAIAGIARERGAYLVHDCTYRDFAHDHHLAARHYPERTITIYSFSKWLGLAGLRVGTFVCEPELAQRLASAPPNNLGSSVLAQRAAIAGLESKAEWFPGVLANCRDNLAMIEAAVAEIPGLVVPVSPSHGNFLIIECSGAGLKPEALCSAFAEHRIMVRQGAYHTPTFGDRFIKVSATVPRAWAVAFREHLPAVVERARGLDTTANFY